MREACVECDRTPESFQCADGASCPEFSEREWRVLAELAHADDSRVAFQGLRRRLRLHQQILTRTLKGLQRLGFVERDGSGYGLTERGYGALRGFRPLQEQSSAVTIATARLPPWVQPADVFRRLSRRWFNALRWYGASRASDETVLTWVLEPSGEAVRVRVTGASISLEVESSVASNERGFRAARALLAALAELYGIEPRAAPGAQDPIPAPHAA